MIKTSMQNQELQPIHGLLFPTGKEARREWKIGDYGRAGVEKIMRGLGSIPETSLTRHPLFATLVRDEYHRQFALAEEAAGRRLTVGEVDEVVLASKREAKRNLERTLFTVTRRSRASSTTINRLAFPFMAAYENSLRRWGNFAKDDISMPLRAAGLVTHVMNGLTLVASDGESLDRVSSTTATGKGFDTESYVVLPGQQITQFVPGKFGRMLQAQAKDLKISTRSMDIVFQGEPGNPGIGPFALLPIVALVKQKPQMEEFLGWTMPVGIPQSEMEVFMPAALKRVKSYMSKDSNYTNAFAAAYLTEQWKFEQGQRDTAPTMDEIKEYTKSFYLLRFLTNLTAPVSVQYANERDQYVAKMRAYRQVYSDDRNEADARFFTDYPETATLVQRLSSNPAGLGSGYQTYENLNAYKQELADAYAHGDPEVAGFIGNYGTKWGEDDFSQAVYQWQRSHSAVPGSKDTFRGVANPEDAVREAQVNEGWRQFTSVTEGMRNKLLSSGITPESPVYDKAMSATKQAASAAIFQQGNQDWWHEYKNPDTAKYIRRAAFFEDLTSNSTFMDEHGDDPLMQSISLYLQQRRQIAYLLDQNSLKGGASTLEAQANLPVQKAWTAWVEQMKADSPEFAAWVDRYFRYDPVTGGAPKGLAEAA